MSRHGPVSPKLADNLFNLCMQSVKSKNVIYGWDHQNMDVIISPLRFIGSFLEIGELYELSQKLPLFAKRFLEIEKLQGL